MRLRNILIVVNDIDKSKQFYHDLFGLNVLVDYDGNMILTEGLVLQDKAIWERFTGREIIPENNASELYFEESDIEGFVEKLEKLYPNTVYVNRLMEHSWGQKVIRFYDPDGNLIEVGTPDEYGGSTWNRTRFGREVIRAVRDAVGPDYPVLFKLTTEEFVAGGLRIAEGREVARIYSKEPVDAITISQGVNATEWAVIAPAHIPPAGFIQHVRSCREVTGDMPIIAIGRILNFDLANNIISDGTADFVCMGRASLADPLAPKKYLEGHPEDIITCIGCVQGCLGNLRKNIPIQCLVNPRTVKEYMCDMTPVADSDRKKVVVVGGGVAGLEAAVAAAKKGHYVSVYEKSGKIGGQWLKAAVPSAKQDFATLVTWCRTQLEKLDVPVYLNTEYTKEMAEETKPDAVIIATGSVEKTLPFPGLDGPNVFKAQEILSGEKNLTGDKVVVVGGGSVGVETAAHMAQDFKDVTILEVRDKISADGEFSNNYFLFRILDEFKVKSYTKAFYQNYVDGTVTFKQKDKIYEIDDVTDIVLAVGSAPINGLKDELEPLGVEVKVVGDAFEVKPGLKNIEQGFFAGLEI